MFLAQLRIFDGIPILPFALRTWKEQNRENKEENQKIKENKVIEVFF